MAAQYTDFYCDTATGSNINAGDDKTVVTSTNGDWGNAAANRFTAAAGTPFSGVSVGDFASVYLDGATTAVYIGRVTAVNAGGASLDISNTVKIGTAPATGATGRSCTTGGKWKGPNGTDGFPLTLMASTLVNTSGYAPRVNIKAGTYSVTAAISRTASGVIFQGYTTSAGDGGRATIDGGNSGASYVLLSNSGVNNVFADLIFNQNGATGSANGLSFTSNEAVILSNVKVSNMRGAGISTAQSIQLLRCELTANNASNTSSLGGIVVSGGSLTAWLCYIHDNTGANSSGISSTSASVRLIRCVVSGNGQYGLMTINANGSPAIINCDFYGNGSHGVAASATGQLVCTIINSNFVKNGGYGINLGVSAGLRSGVMLNCGFGSGATYANVSGTTTGMSAIEEVGSVNYTTHPYEDPTTSDFDITSSEAKSAGYGTFPALSSITGRPNIGAASPTSSGGGSFVWAQ